MWDLLLGLLVVLSLGALVTVALVTVALLLLGVLVQLLWPPDEEALIYFKEGDLYEGGLW